MMIYAVVLIVLLILTWLYLMFITWKITPSESTQANLTTLFIRWQQSLRLLRRGWYTSGLYTKYAAEWSNHKMSEAFIKLFPTSAPAFVKRDLLTGLHKGPTSFFLKSISTPKKSSRRLPRSKKML